MSKKYNNTKEFNSKPIILSERQKILYHRMSYAIENHQSKNTPINLHFKDTKIDQHLFVEQFFSSKFTTPKQNDYLFTYDCSLSHQNHNLYVMLRSIIHFLRDKLGVDIKESLLNKKLYEEFSIWLNQASDMILKEVILKERIFIVIHHADLLTDDYMGNVSSHVNGWLPSELPDRIVVISTTSNWPDNHSSYQQINFNSIEIELNDLPIVKIDPIFADLIDSLQNRVDNEYLFYFIHQFSTNSHLDKGQIIEILMNLTDHPRFFYIETISDFWIVFFDIILTINNLTSKVKSNKNSLNKLFKYISLVNYGLTTSELQKLTNLDLLFIEKYITIFRNEFSIKNVSGKDVIIINFNVKSVSIHF